MKPVCGFSTYKAKKAGFAHSADRKGREVGVPGIYNQLSLTSSDTPYIAPRDDPSGVRGCGALWGEANPSIPCKGDTNLSQHTVRALHRLIVGNWAVNDHPDFRHPH